MTAFSQYQVNAMTRRIAASRWARKRKGPARDRTGPMFSPLGDGRSYFDVSTVPVSGKPSRCLVAAVRSNSRLPEKGPRSITLTFTDFPR